MAQTTLLIHHALEPGELKQAAALHRLAKVAGRPAFLPAQLKAVQDALASSTSHCLCAWVPGSTDTPPQLVGAAVYLSHPHATLLSHSTLQLLSVVVRADLRRQGIGKKLIQHILTDTLAASTTQLLNQTSAPPSDPPTQPPTTHIICWLDTSTQPAMAALLHSIGFTVSPHPPSGVSPAIAPGFNFPQCTLLELIPQTDPTTSSNQSTSSDTTTTTSPPSSPQSASTTPTHIPSTTHASSTAHTPATIHTPATNSETPGISTTSDTTDMDTHTSMPTTPTTRKGWDAFTDDDELDEAPPTTPGTTPTVFNQPPTTINYQNQPATSHPLSEVFPPPASCSATSASETQPLHTAVVSHHDGITAGKPAGEQSGDPKDDDTELEFESETQAGSGGGSAWDALAGWGRTPAHEHQQASSSLPEGGSMCVVMQSHHLPVVIDMHRNATHGGKAVFGTGKKFQGVEDMLRYMAVHGISSNSAQDPRGDPTADCLALVVPGPKGRGIMGAITGQLEPVAQSVGQSSGHTAATQLVVLSVVVSERSRRTGLGSELLAALIAWGTAQGAQRVVTDVAAVNTAAVGFFKREGFLLPTLATAPGGAASKTSGFGAVGGGGRDGGVVGGGLNTVEMMFMLPREGGPLRQGGSAMGVRSTERIEGRPAGTGTRELMEDVGLVVGDRGQSAVSVGGCVAKNRFQRRLSRGRVPRGTTKAHSQGGAGFPEQDTGCCLLEPRAMSWVLAHGCKGVGQHPCPRLGVVSGAMTSREGKGVRPGCTRRGGVFLHPLMSITSVALGCHIRSTVRSPHFR